MSPLELPEHPDHPRILAAFNQATEPLRAKDVCEALGHELLPKNVEGTHAKLKRLVKLGILTEADTGNFAQEAITDTTSTSDLLPPQQETDTTLRTTHSERHPVHPRPVGSTAHRKR
ncbi:hypothetical protein [Streptomyces sp. NPDC002324]